jgi:hypothetical protein
MKARNAASLLLIPLQTSALLWIGLCAMVGSFAVNAGIIARLQSALLLSLMLTGMISYSFALLDAVAAGKREAPVMSMEMLNLLEDKRTLVLLLVVALLTGGAWYLHAPLLAGIVTVLLVPAIIGMLTISGHVLVAFDPREWLKLVRWLRGDYLIAASWWIGLAGVAWLLYGQWRGAPGMLREALLLYGWLAGFTLLGGAIHARRDEAEFDWVEEVELAPDPAALARAHDRAIDHIYASWRGGAHHNAWQSLIEQVAASPDAIAELQHIYRRALAWPDQRLADRIAQEQVTRLLAARRTGEALDLTRDRLAAQPTFRPRSAEETRRVAELARAAGDRPTERRLLEVRDSTST